MGSVPRACRVVHFDVKSANILLGRDWTAKIADVGLAKILKDGMLSTLHEVRALVIEPVQALPAARPLRGPDSSRRAAMPAPFLQPTRCWCCERALAWRSA